MKTKTITNRKQLQKLQKAMQEIGIFDLQFQQYEKGDKVKEEITKRVFRAAISIIESLPEI